MHNKKKFKSHFVDGSANGIQNNNIKKKLRKLSSTYNSNIYMIFTTWTFEIKIQMNIENAHFVATAYTNHREKCE